MSKLLVPGQKGAISTELHYNIINRYTHCWAWSGVSYITLTVVSILLVTAKDTQMKH